MAWSQTGSASAPVTSVAGRQGAVTLAVADLADYGAHPSSMFGPGSDGAADLDGTNTVAWASKAGNVYTMTRCAYLTTLRVRAGCTLVKRFIPFVSGTLTVDATGVVADDGNDAVANTAGGTISTLTRLPESSGNGGAAGRNTTGNGTPASNTTSAYGGAGGAGGISGGGNTGGAGGTLAEPTEQVNTLRGTGFMGGIYLLGTGATLYRPAGGSGGGSGGATLGTGTATSGGGGSGAAISMIFARQIANAGTIRCNGGAGGNAAATGNGAAGGGGGGGGGYLIVVSNTALANAGTIQANGGAGGAGAGGGASGAAGAAGTVEYRGP